MTLKLTPLQREVWLLRSRGLTNKEIAIATNRSRSTVENGITDAIKANPGYNNYTLLAEFVREQCREGVWE